MINDIEELVTSVTDAFKDSEMKLEELNDNKEVYISYLIDEIILNDLLSIIAEFCTENEYSFSILRDKYAQIKVIFFDKLIDKTLEIIFFTQKPNEIDSQLIVNYDEKVKKRSKVKIIPVVGPDGAGKTTLTKQTIADINQNTMYIKYKKIIRRSIMYNIFYPINRFLLGKKPDKNQHDDTHYLLSLCAGLGFYPYLIFLTLFRKKIILMDRFFYDYLLKDISYFERITTLRENWQGLLKYIPKPYILFHIDANAEIILSRKEGLTADDVEKYRTINFTLYLNNPSIVYLYVNSGIELDQCKKIIASTLIKSNIIVK